MSRNGPERPTFTVMTERTVIDTNILIAMYNEGKFREKFLQLNQISKVLVSVVTVNELLRGCHDKQSLGIVDEFLGIFESQFLVPSQESWIECARISERILRSRKRTKGSVLLLQNDILIALNARDAKAVLITADKKDFGLLRDFMEVQIVFW